MIMTIVLVLLVVMNTSLNLEEVDETRSSTTEQNHGHNHNNESGGLDNLLRLCSDISIRQGEGNGATKTCPEHTHLEICRDLALLAAKVQQERKREDVHHARNNKNGNCAGNELGSPGLVTGKERETEVAEKEVLAHKVEEAEKRLCVFLRNRAEIVVRVVLLNNTTEKNRHDSRHSNGFRQQVRGVREENEECLLKNGVVLQGGVLHHQCVGEGQNGTNAKGTQEATDKQTEDLKELACIKSILALLELKHSTGIASLVPLSIHTSSSPTHREKWRWHRSRHSHRTQWRSNPHLRANRGKWQVW
eukprot:Colp12_sorted_trinity150504_noHs@14029